MVSSVDNLDTPCLSDNVCSVTRSCCIIFNCKGLLFTVYIDQVYNSNKNHNQRHFDIYQCVAFAVLRVRQFPVLFRVSHTTLPLPRHLPLPLHPPAPTGQQPRQQQSPASLSPHDRSPWLLMAHLLWETMPGGLPGLWSSSARKARAWVLV